MHCLGSYWNPPIKSRGVCLEVRQTFGRAMASLCNLFCSLGFIFLFLLLSLLLTKWNTLWKCSIKIWEVKHAVIEKCAQIQNSDVLKQFLCSAFLNSRNHSVESGARRPYVYISLHFSAPWHRIRIVLLHKAYRPLTVIQSSQKESTPLTMWGVWMK